MRVLVICDPGGVSEYYRAATPYMMLAQNGLIDRCVQNDGHNPAIIDHLTKFDAVVFSRADSPEHSLILLHAKQRGLRTIYDVDDNLLLIPPSIGVYHAWHERGTGKITPRTWHFKKNIRLADVLTVSTVALGRQLCDGEPHRLRAENDYLVLPNQVVAADWQVEPQNEDGGNIWVGWWGIYNHWDDWRDVAAYIEPVIAERDNVRLALLGMPELAHLFPKLRKQGRLIIGPFVAPGQLSQYRALVKRFDIALAPTSPCPFNESKSDLKMLQYGAAGLPVIASRTTYGEWWRYASILDRPEQWGEALARTLDDLAEARQKARALREHVLAKRTYEKNYMAWLAALGLMGTVALPRLGNSEVPAGSRYWNWVMEDEQTERATA